MMLLDLLLPVVVMLLSLTGLQTCEDGFQQFFFALSGWGLLKEMQREKVPLLYRMGFVFAIIVVAFCAATLIESRIA